MNYELRLLKNCFSFVILSEAKNLYVHFEKKTRFFVAALLRMTILEDFSEVSN
jgi:hypothetical protein